MNSTLSRVEAWSLLTLSAACVGIIVNTFQGDGEPLIASLAFSGIAFSFTFSLIRWLGDRFIKANLKGRDMSKLKKVEMYEVLQFTTLSHTDIQTARKLWEPSALLSIFL